MESFKAKSAAVAEGEKWSTLSEKKIFLRSGPLEATGGSRGPEVLAEAEEGRCKGPGGHSKLGAGREKPCWMHLKEPRRKLKMGRWGWNVGKAETENPRDGQEGLGLSW